MLLENALMLLQVEFGRLVGLQTAMAPAPRQHRIGNSRVALKIVLWL